MLVGNLNWFKIKMPMTGLYSYTDILLCLIREGELFIC
jgi:hypothetical protein